MGSGRITAQRWYIYRLCSQRCLSYGYGRWLHLWSASPLRPPTFSWTLPPSLQQGGNARYASSSCLRILLVQFPESPHFRTRLDTPVQRGKVGQLVFASTWRGESWLRCCGCVTSPAMFRPDVINRTGCSPAALSSRGRDGVTSSAQLLPANVLPLARLAKGWSDVCVPALSQWTECTRKVLLILWYKYFMRPRKALVGAVPCTLNVGHVNGSGVLIIMKQLWETNAGCHGSTSSNNVTSFLRCFQCSKHNFPSLLK